MNKLWALLFCALLFSSVSAQNKCGHKLSGTALESQLQFTPGYFGCNFIERFDRVLQINAFIGLDSAGLTTFDLPELIPALEQLNEDFAPCGLQFEICKTTYIPNFQYDAYVNTEHEEQVTVEYYEPNTINIYFFTQMIRDGETVCGYAYFPGGKDQIFMAKGCSSAGDHSLTHEMGHFFGLHHTFETDFGDELVDGSNCESTGDLICDTAADPDPDGNANADQGCAYTGATTLDANNEWYIPPVDNYMSYYPQDCTCRFTPQQFNRMLEQYHQLRNYLW